MHELFSSGFRASPYAMFGFLLVALVYQTIIVSLLTASLTKHKQKLLALAPLHYFHLHAAMQLGLRMVVEVFYHRRQRIYLPRPRALLYDHSKDGSQPVGL